MRPASSKNSKVSSPHGKKEATEISGELAQSQNPFPIVGIGASAGGLEAFTQLLNHLPNDTGMAFVLVQHLDPAHRSQLANLLASATAMPVLEIKDKMRLAPNRVFVIPPNVNLDLARGRFKLTPRGESRIAHSVNHFFCSLAREHQNCAIGVVLSGTGSDGTVGLTEIKVAGGITFAQDEKSAKFSGMPLHARLDSVDFILPPEKIAAELARIGKDPYLAVSPKTENEATEAANAKDYRRILTLLRSNTGADLSQYRDTTIKRRIQRRMVVATCHTLTDYIERLEKDPNEVTTLFNDTLINVTSFFRDPEMFETLKARIFPEILKSSPQTIRIWVAACSTGQEAYSLAIALLEFLEKKPNPPGIQIFATDISETVIEKGRRGYFTENIDVEVSPERLRRFFTKEDGGYRISKNIRDLCVFARQNVTGDPPFSRMNLVSCRNLLIYFTPPLQRHVISTFHYALNPSGYLVLGNSETVGANSDLFEMVDRKHKIYSNKGMAARPFANFSAADLKPGALATTHGKIHAPGPGDFQKEADRVLLGRFAPAAVLVNSNLEVLQFRGRTSPYLEPPNGPASFNLLKMARDNLPLELGKAIREARRQNKPVRASAHLHDSETVRKINVEVVPLKLTGSIESCFLILFEEIGKQSVELENKRRRKKEMADAKRPVAEKDSELQQLRQDLAAAREYLQAVIEQHDASNEELKCANEEVLSSNEELQSTNEQLGTAKEELQSTNEELITLNEELQTRNVELAQLNSELKSAHEKLMDYLTAVVDTVRGPFLVLRENLEVQQANRAFYETFQVSVQETENCLIYELGNGQWNIPQLRKLLSEISHKSALKDFEMTHHFPQIGRRDMRVNARRLEQKPGATPMILLSIEDITEFKQIEEINQWLAAIVESSGDAIIGKDLNGKIISCNEGASALFGYQPEELIGQPVTILIPPELHANETMILDRIRRGESIEHFETVRRRKDGSLVEVSLTVSPVKDTHGKIIGASKIARDISEHKHIEKTLADTLAREKAARETAESASRAKDDFLAVLSHELRTPLNPVLLLASDAAKNRDLPPGARADFEIVRKNIELEARLIDDLLDVTRITYGKLALELQTVDAHLILNDAIATAKPEMAKKEIELVLNVKAKPSWVRADAVRLQQVFWNVLKNAVKFTPAGGKIQVETSVEHGKFCTKINDTGIGLTADEMQRIFSAFSQGDHSGSREFGGLGLGLAISRRLMEFHSGRILAASDGRNRGATFTIELPLTKPENGNLPSTKNLGAVKKPKGTEARILLVEDHEPTRDALARLLIRRKYKVAAAATLAEARQLSEKNQFDLLISDIGLPDGNGNELMAELRERQGLEGIALTGYGMEEDVARTVASGFTMHLTKPVTVQALEKALTQTIGAR